MRKLLWIGDAVVASGFARCTHKVLDVLRHTWEVAVLGINHVGDPHPYPYPIFPAMPGGDGFGIGRVRQLCEAMSPDVVVVQADTWLVPEYLAKVPKGIPVVASMPVDGMNCRGSSLNELASAVFWTQFGWNEARRGGYRGEGTIIPLGVDLEMYTPVAKAEARSELGWTGVIPDNAFVVGNVNRNQPRKRIDLTIRYFAKWIEKHHVNNAWLFLYVSPTGETGVDPKQLMHYYGFVGDRKRLLLATPNVGMGNEEELLKQVYSSFDVQVSTSQGEGWGLTTMEGMACGVPQIVPRFAALGEWAKPASLQVPCTAVSVTPQGINVVGGVADEEAFIAALQQVYSSQQTRAELSAAGHKLVSQHRFRWADIGRAFAEELERVHNAFRNRGNGRATAESKSSSGEAPKESVASSTQSV